MPGQLSMLGCGRGPGGGAGTPVDLLVRFESGADAASLTTGDLDSATLKTAAAAGSWSIPILAPVISTAQELTVNGLSVNGAGSSDAGGTRSIRMNTAQDQILCRYTLTTAAPAVSCGFAWRVASGGTFNFYNWAELTGTGGGEYAAFHHRDFTPMEVGIEDGASNLGSLITVTGGTWYWVTMLFDNTNNVIRMRVYNSSFVQVGVESSLTPALTQDCNRIMVGRTDNHDVFGTEDGYIDDLAVCLSTGVGATFPLLPT